MAFLLKILSGWKTYLAAAGFVGKALFDASNKNYSDAFLDLMAALTAAGLRGAISNEAKKQTEEIRTITADQTKELSPRSAINPTGFAPRQPI